MLCIQLVHIITVLLHDIVPLDFHCRPHLAARNGEVGGQDGPLLDLLGIGGGFLGDDTLTLPTTYCTTGESQFEK